MTLKDTLIILLVVSLMSLISNVLGTKATIIESIPGLIILAGIAFSGIAMSRLLPGGIPAAAYVVTLGCIVTYPTFPGAEIINSYVKNIGFVALCTPILAYAGISIGKDLNTFAKNGWRIILVSCVVFIGTYIASAVIAEFILKSLGQI